MTTASDTRAVVLLAGDSNITRGAQPINDALTGGSHLDDAYAVALVSKEGALFRGSYWPAKFAGLFPKVQPDIVVTNLGINDAAFGGTLANYATGIDRYMGAAAGRPVLWSNLPVVLEPAAKQPYAQLVNDALAAALARWPNLTILDWETAACGNQSYMIAPGTDVHYTSAGYVAWAALVVGCLDARYSAT